MTGLYTGFLKIDPFIIKLIRSLISGREATGLKPKNEANLTSLIVGAVCIIMAAAAGISLHEIVSRLSGWQDVGYMLVAGIFIALTAVILNRILSFFFDD